MRHDTQSIHTTNVPTLRTKFNVIKHVPHIGTLIVIWSAELIQCDGTLNLLMPHAMIAMTTTSNVRTYTLVPVTQIHSAAWYM